MKFLKLFRASLKIVYNAAPGLFFIRVLILLLSSVSGLWMMYATQQLFLSVEQQGQSGDALTRFCFFAAAFLFSIFAGSVYDYFSIVVSERYTTAFHKLFHEKAGRIAAADFERSELSDLLEGAGMGIYSMGYFVSDILGILFYDIPYLLLVGGYLFWLDPLLLLAPIVIFIPVIVTLLLRAGEHVKYRDELANLKRKGKHYKEAVSAPAFMKETRSFGCYSFFMEKYKSNMELEQEKEWKLEFHTQTKELFSKLVTLAGYAAVLYLLYISLCRGEISVGTFSAVFYGIVQLYGTMERLVLGKFKNVIVQDYASIGNFVRFIEYSERQYGKEDLTAWDRLELRHVSFHYESRQEKRCRIST